MSVIDALMERITRLERSLSNVVVYGTVTEVDPAKQRVRVKTGESDGEDVKTPWIPYQQTAGALKVHSPPSVGQQMRVINPGGLPENGMAEPMTWSNANATPNTNANEHQITFGSFSAVLKGGELAVTVPTVRVTCGGTTWVFSGAGEVQTGGSKTHDGKNVGKDHKHLDVVVGGDLTGIPNSA